MVISKYWHWGTLLLTLNMKSPWGSSALYCRCIYLTKHKDNISNIEKKINFTFWLLVFCIFNGVICQIRIKIRGQELLRFLSIHIKSEISWVTASLVQRVLFPLNIPWNTVYILPVAKFFMNKQASESESHSIEFPRSPTDTLHRWAGQCWPLWNSVLLGSYSSLSSHS